jgi:hypothetical protein
MHMTPRLFITSMIVLLLLTASCSTPQDKQDQQPSSLLPVELKVYNGGEIHKYECQLDNISLELGRCLPVIRFTYEPYCS